MNKVLVIMGPTGVGKTNVSIEIAKKLNGEIISADSMQIYRKLDIGTAKITETEKEGIKHHLIDIKEINEEYSVQEFVSDAKIIIQEILNNGKVPIIVGGTGLYIKALIENFNFANTNKNEEFREQCEQIVLEKGLVFLYDKLSEKIGTESIKKIDKNNKKRIIRALEIAEFGDFCSKENSTQKYEYVCIGLYLEREKLYERINHRVELMLKQEVLKEVELIYKDGNKQSKQAIGYKEFFPYLECEKTLKECVEKLKQNTRNYAKRQLTWMRGMKNLVWIENKDNVTNKIIEIFKGK